MEKVIVGLINGRHEMPVNEYIFDEIKDVLDFSSIRAGLVRFLEERVGISQQFGAGVNQCDYTDVNCFRGQSQLVVYVTTDSPVCHEWHCAVFDAL